ncbi:hypothetical protein CEUSTIGMA_g1812.t1 [Chlamydomonas eustigma]|uniref:Uncharacterized protein n=1 Tax=Chlamydomonas eustigma TaxID=1157962 RepID=A0A250WU61_9CHLO|nr:hypothetical protein CEUSTIGMA_g1812.t1 [Chlamydomonas eustigma]|eukprot:GAX74363.1 hypothetical protein CEUSTIGMA_g1812.t1 [Chlamydomonas eustigma]
MALSTADLAALSSEILQALKDRHVLFEGDSYHWRRTSDIICKAREFLEAANVAPVADRRIFYQNWEYSISMKKLLDLIHSIATAAHLNNINVASESKTLHEALQLVNQLNAAADGASAKDVWDWLLKKQNGLIALCSAMVRRMARGPPVDIGVYTGTAFVHVSSGKAEGLLTYFREEVLEDVGNLLNSLHLLSEIWMQLIIRFRMNTSWTHRKQFIQIIQGMPTREFLQGLLHFLNKLLRCLNKELVVPVCDRYPSLRGQSINRERLGSAFNQQQGQQHLLTDITADHDGTNLEPIKYLQLISSNHEGAAVLENMESMIENVTRMLFQVADMCKIQSSSSAIGHHVHSPAAAPLSQLLQSQIISISLPYLSHTILRTDRLQLLELYSVSEFILDALTSVPAEIDFITCCMLVNTILLVTCPQAELIPHTMLKQLYRNEGPSSQVPQEEEEEEAADTIECAKSLLMKSEMLFNVAKLILTNIDESSPDGSELRTLNKYCNVHSALKANHEKAMDQARKMKELLTQRQEQLSRSLLLHHQDFSESAAGGGGSVSCCNDDADDQLKKKEKKQLTKLVAVTQGVYDRLWLEVTRAELGLRHQELVIEKRLQRLLVYVSSFELCLRQLLSKRGAVMANLLIHNTQDCACGVLRCALSILEYDQKDHALCGRLSSSAAASAASSSRNNMGAASRSCFHNQYIRIWTSLVLTVIKVAVAGTRHDDNERLRSHPAGHHAVHGETSLTEAAWKLLVQLLTKDIAAPCWWRERAVLVAHRSDDVVVGVVAEADALYDNHASTCAGSHLLDAAEGIMAASNDKQPPATAAAAAAAAACCYEHDNVHQQPPAAATTLCSLQASSSMAACCLLPRLSAAFAVFAVSYCKAFHQDGCNDEAGQQSVFAVIQYDVYQAIRFYFVQMYHQGHRLFLEQPGALCVTEIPVIPEMLLFYTSCCWPVDEILARSLAHILLTEACSSSSGSSSSNDLSSSSRDEGSSSCRQSKNTSSTIIVSSPAVLPPRLQTAFFLLSYLIGSTRLSQVTDQWRILKSSYFQSKSNDCASATAAAATSCADAAESRSSMALKGTTSPSLQSCVALVMPHRNNPTTTVAGGTTAATSNVQQGPNDQGLAAGSSRSSHGLHRADDDDAVIAAFHVVKLSVFHLVQGQVLQSFLQVLYSLRSNYAASLWHFWKQKTLCGIVLLKWTEDIVSFLNCILSLSERPSSVVAAVATEAGGAAAATAACCLRENSDALVCSCELLKDLKELVSLLIHDDDGGGGGGFHNGDTTPSAARHDETAVTAAATASSASDIVTSTRYVSSCCGSTASSSSEAVAEVADEVADEVNELSVAGSSVMDPPSAGVGGVGGVGGVAHDDDQLRTTTDSGGEAATILFSSFTHDLRSITSQVEQAAVVLSSSDYKNYSAPPAAPYHKIHDQNDVHPPSQASMAVVLRALELTASSLSSARKLFAKLYPELHTAVQLQTVADASSGIILLSGGTAEETGGNETHEGTATSSSVNNCSCLADELTMRLGLWRRRSWSLVEEKLLSHQRQLVSGWGEGLWCFNPACSNVSGTSELQLKTYACGDSSSRSEGWCRRARYCSRECQAQDWKASST